MFEKIAKINPINLFFAFNSFAMVFFGAICVVGYRYTNIEFVNPVTSILRGLALVILFCLFLISYKISMKEIKILLKKQI